MGLWAYGPGMPIRNMAVCRSLVLAPMNGLVHMVYSSIFIEQTKSGMCLPVLPDRKFNVTSSNR